MTTPYLTLEGDNVVRCLCKGCGEMLWERHAGALTPSPLYGDLYLAMIAPDGSLSKHSTPLCSRCSTGALDLAALYRIDIDHLYLLAKTDRERAQAMRMLDLRPVRILRWVAFGEDHRAIH